MVLILDGNLEDAAEENSFFNNSNSRMLPYENNAWNK